MPRYRTDDEEDDIDLELGRETMNRPGGYTPPVVAPQAPLTSAPNTYTLPPAVVQEVLQDLGKEEVQRPTGVSQGYAGAGYWGEGPLAAGEPVADPWSNQPGPWLPVPAGTTFATPAEAYAWQWEHWPKDKPWPGGSVPQEPQDSGPPGANIQNKDEGSLFASSESGSPVDYSDIPEYGQTDTDTTDTGTTNTGANAGTSDTDTEGAEEEGEGAGTTGGADVGGAGAGENGGGAGGGAEDGGEPPTSASDAAEPTLASLRELLGGLNADWASIKNAARSYGATKTGLIDEYVKSLQGESGARMEAMQADLAALGRGAAERAAMGGYSSLGGGAAGATAQAQLEGLGMRAKERAALGEKISAAEAEKINIPKESIDVMNDALNTTAGTLLAGLGQEGALVMQGALADLDAYFKGEKLELENKALDAQINQWAEAMKLDRAKFDESVRQWKDSFGLDSAKFLFMQAMSKADAQQQAYQFDQMNRIAKKKLELDKERARWEREGESELAKAQIEQIDAQIDDLRESWLDSIFG